MSVLEIPAEIRIALALMTAERYEISTTNALLWVHDIEEKGTKSIYFEQVKPLAMEFFGPILSVLMPVVEQLLQAAVNATISRSKEIGESTTVRGMVRRIDDGFDVAEEREKILRHVDDPNGEKEIRVHTDNPDV